MPLIQDGRHLGFGFRRFSHQHLGRLVRFFGGSLGVTGGRLLSIISFPLGSKGQETGAIARKCP
jgi:hypothetical protein